MSRTYRFETAAQAERSGLAHREPGMVFGFVYCPETKRCQGQVGFELGYWGIYLRWVTR